MGGETRNLRGGSRRLRVWGRSTSSHGGGGQKLGEKTKGEGGRTRETD